MYSRSEWQENLHGARAGLSRFRASLDVATDRQRADAIEWHLCTNTLSSFETIEAREEGLKAGSPVNHARHRYVGHLAQKSACLGFWQK